MCGIVGYIGNRNTIDVLLNGLTSLEYRGYDSSGVSIYDRNDKNIKIFKAEGKLNNLKKILKNDTTLKTPGIGIGHIRWATHGIPSIANAHPHTCNCGNLVIVHNGIIENYLELKNKLENLGCKFKSQTDTETIAHLIAQKYKEEQNLTNAVRKALKELKKAERRLAIVSDKFKEKPFESYYDDKEVEEIIKKQADKLVDEEVEKNRKEKSYNQFIDMIDDKK